MRRILIIPSISTSSVVESKSYKEFYSFTEEICDIEQAFFFMVIPPWIKDGLRGHKSLYYAHIETTRDLDINDIAGYSTYDLSMWFARRGGRFVVDAIITDCVNFALNISAVLSDPRRDPIPVFVRDLNSRYKRAKSDSDELLMASSILGSRFCYYSKSHRSRVFEFLSKSILPSKVRCMKDNMVHWPLALDTMTLESVELADKMDKPSFVFSGNPKVNRGTFILAAYEKLYALGFHIAVVSKYSEAQNISLHPNKVLDFVGDMKVDVRSEIFYSEVSKHHVFLSATEDEQEFFSELERLFLGCVGVFSYSEISDEVFQNYPFLYNKDEMEQALDLCVWIAENYDEALAMIKPHVDSLSKRFSQDVSSEIFWEQSKRVINSQYRMTGDSELYKVSKTVAEGLGDEFAFSVFLDVLEESLPWLKPWGRKGTLLTLGRVKAPLPTVYDLREILDNLGWKDMHDSEEVRLKKI